MKAAKANEPNIFDKIILFVNALFALALLLSYVAPSTDPRSASLIAVLGFGYQVLLAVNIAFVLFWLFRSKRYALLSLTCILTGYYTFVSYFSFHSNHSVGNTKASSKAMRLMEYNVRGFRGIGRYQDDASYNPILQLIKAKQPDIIAFAEYSVHKADAVAITDSVKNLLHTTYNYFKNYNPPSKDASGLAIFSKLPFIDTGSVLAPDALQTQAIYADVKYEGKIVRIYCVHLASVDINYGVKTQYLNGKLNINKTSFIQSKLVEAFVMRSHQLAYIKEHLEKCPYPYIITGDFNDTPNSFAVNTLGEGLKNAFVERGSGLGVTYYSKFPKLQIDYILTTPQFDVLSYEAIDQEISDHKPVISDLMIK